jgi:hypothetical protein
LHILIEGRIEIADTLFEAYFLLVGQSNRQSATGTATLLLREKHERQKRISSFTTGLTPKLKEFKFTVMENDIKEAALKYSFIASAEYLEMERASAFRSEYFQGYVQAMSGVSLKHNIIDGNLIFLWQIFDQLLIMLH